MPKKILVVDDEPDILKVVCYRLRKEHYEVIEAVDGQEALDILKIQTPDLILLDLYLPKIDGYEVCRRVKADEKLKKIPVILLTATAADGKEKIEELGAEDCVIKPFQAEALLEKIKKLIG